MIQEAREALFNLLDNAGIRASEFVPERITPPLAVVEPASGWIQPGDVFGTFRIGFDVTVIVPTASNQVVASTLDTNVDEVLTALHGADGFYVGEVQQPQILSVQNAEFLTATMTVYQITSL